MAAYREFNHAEFAKLAHYLYVLSVRYNVVCHRSPAEQEQAYNGLAIGVSSGTHTRAGYIKNSPQFRKLYSRRSLRGRFRPLADAEPAFVEEDPVPPLDDRVGAGRDDPLLWCGLGTCVPLQSGR